MIVSIFNDVIGPVMRGPSSSHCAAALRIGRLARDLMDGQLADLLVEFDRNGSLPTTHESHGSDMGLFGGLMGWDAADERLAGSPEALREAGVQIRIETVDAADEHPNTYRLTLRNGSEQHSLIARMLEIVRILRRSSQQGIAGTQYEDRILGHQCGKFDDLMRRGRLLNGGALNRIVLYVTALMEVKSSMGVIVAAPTAGACTALGGLSVTKTSLAIQDRLAAKRAAACGASSCGCAR